MPRFNMARRGRFTLGLRRIPSFCVRAPAGAPAAIPPCTARTSIRECCFEMTNGANDPIEQGRPRSRCSRFVMYQSSFAITFYCCSGFSGRAAVDESKLPPAANVKIDFDRDIKPIFEASCWRCHGPARPKSHFRLDNRQSALKGGDNGIDIKPGDSAKSPLIHYVARLVPELEMPPPGKGEPLTAQQVGLLRAWIDQDAVWGVTNP